MHLKTSFLGGGRKASTRARGEQGKRGIHSTASSRRGGGTQIGRREAEGDGETAEAR